jgi:SHS2 domain-containing protein
LVYSYLDHISDVYVHVSSDSLSGIFEDAAKATYEVMLDTSAVKEKTTLDSTIKADDLEQLLYMWVDYLLYIFDAKSFAMARAKVKVSKTKGSAPISLSAKIYGEDYDPSLHGQKVGVKAMTYSLMRIIQERGRWEAYFVLDI